jgi:hypothetical protein
MLELEVRWVVRRPPWWFAGLELHDVWVHPQLLHWLIRVHLTPAAQQVNEPEMILDEPNTFPEKVPAMSPALIVTVPTIARLLPA